MNATPLPLLLVSLAVSGVYLFLVALSLKRTELDRRNWLYPAWLITLALAAITYDPRLMGWVEIPETLFLILVLYHLGRVQQEQTDRDLALTTLGYLLTYLAAATHEGRFGPETLLPALNFTLLLHATILYFRSGPNHRWAVKHLVAAAYLITGYQLLVQWARWQAPQYLEELLFLQPLAYLAALPFVVLFVTRTPSLGIKLHISRHAAHLAMLLIVTLGGLHGLYLLHRHSGLLDRAVDDPWWAYAALALLTPVLGLLVIRRSSIKSFINQHFYNFKYDYRESWLQVTKRLTGALSDDQRLHRTAVELFLETFDCDQGALWLRQGPGFGLVHQIDQRFPTAHLPERDPVIRFLANWQWVIDVDELQAGNDLYPGLRPTPWLLEAQPRVWLVLPLLVNAELYGFVTLGHSRARRRIDWEDIDLAKTVGRQMAISLLQADSARQLAEAKQFSAYNKLATYVIHDLKNIISQLDLIHRNYERYRDNPEFIDDMHHTLASALDKMRLLLSRVTATAPGRQRKERVVLGELLQQLRERYRRLPKSGLRLDIDTDCPDAAVEADRDKLLTVIGNVVNNAIEAIPEGGHVQLRCHRESDRVILEIRDDGVGMDEEFIRTRLFKPFETTKGIEGMGIGMYETKEYLESLGGHVEVESRPGHGTTVRLHLPRA